MSTELENPVTCPACDGDGSMSAQMAKERWMSLGSGSVKRILKQGTTSDYQTIYYDKDGKELEFKTIGGPCSVCGGLKVFEVQRPIASRIVGRKSIDSWQVFRWPEFIAFAKRLGIDLDLPWNSLIITMKIGEVPTVTQTYLTDDIDQQHTKHALETTNAHNSTFRTFEPPTLK